MRRLKSWNVPSSAGTVRASEANVSGTWNPPERSSCGGQLCSGKGRVERQVLIAYEHVLAGQESTSLGELDEAFCRWVPVRRGQVHRTHGEVLGVRAARDHAALGPIPARVLLVSESRLRRVGRDSMISFECSSYSVAARASNGRVTKAGQRVEVRFEAAELVIRRLPGDSPAGTALDLRRHRKATERGQLIVDPAH